MWEYKFFGSSFVKEGNNLVLSMLLEFLFLIQAFTSRGFVFVQFLISEENLFYEIHEARYYVMLRRESLRVHPTY